MSAGVGRLERAAVWAFDEEKELSQWFVVFVIVACFAAVICGITSRELIWPEDWVVSRLWPLPVELSRDFALLGESTIVDMTTVDPLIFNGSEERGRFWSKAAGRSEHFLYIRPTFGSGLSARGVGLQFLVKNPEEVQPLAWEEHIQPLDASWRGQFIPVDAAVNRARWGLNVEYHFFLSEISWAILVVEGTAVVVFTLWIYGKWLRPAHVKIAENLREW